MDEPIRLWGWSIVFLYTQDNDIMTLNNITVAIELVYIVFI